MSMKFSDKRTCQIIIENLFIKCVFPVLETFISSSLIKIVCKCNQIRGNESWWIFQEEISRKKNRLFIIVVIRILPQENMGNVVYLFVGTATYIKSPKTGWLKQ